MKTVRYRFFIKSLILWLFTIALLTPYAYSKYEKNFSISGTVIKIPIDDLFEDECLSCGGKRILFELKDELGGGKIFLECSVNRKSIYNSDWELANIYAYKTALYLIQCCGIKPSDITYIGCGSMSKFDKEPNRIEITLSYMPDK